MTDWQYAVDVCDVPPGKAARVCVGGVRLAICNDAGRFVAVDDSCPHEGGSLGRGHVADGCVVCSVHHWPFDLKTGLTDPKMPMVRLKFHPCRVRDGKVYVDPSHPIPPRISDLIAE
ncbi:MAG TPA: Rieske 2Fe-2S domain-containing protein [Phycisphaerae bacterium]|nr:Rieske 2Fe-2S domain-containing protein [Phycisphaerae bacterium]